MAARALLLLHALAGASALVISPVSWHSSHLAPRAACPMMDGDGPMVGRCKWFK